MSDRDGMRGGSAHRGDHGIACVDVIPPGIGDLHEDLLFSGLLDLVPFFAQIDHRGGKFEFPLDIAGGVLAARSAGQIKKRENVPWIGIAPMRFRKRTLANGHVILVDEHPSVAESNKLRVMAVLIP